MISVQLLPQEERIQELYHEGNTGIDCVQAWQAKYGNFEDAINMLDKYDIALTALEHQYLELEALFNKAERLLAEAQDYMDNAHGYNSESYQNITNYLNEQTDDI